MDKKLYAWADNTNFGVGQHTWISTYKPASGEPDTAKGNYWYCWGDAHDNAILLHEGAGGIDFAQRIARPHDKQENVGIEYAKDGVCHQMANRLLRFSLDPSSNPVTVIGAKGYQLTKAMYGEYGDKAQTEAQRKRLDKWEEAVRNHEKRAKGDNNGSI